MATQGATNRVTTGPAWTPAFIRRHPALLVEWLRLANALSRREWGSRTAWLLLSAVAVAGALFVSLSGRVAGTISTLAEYWVLLAVIAAVYASTSVNRRRRQLEEAASQSWLIATPIPSRSLRLSLAIRALFPLGVLMAAVVMVPALVALTNEGIVAAAETVAASAVGGLFIGGVVGWWMSRRVEPSGVVPSRYVPRPRHRGAMPAYVLRPRRRGSMLAYVLRPRRRGSVLVYILRLRRRSSMLAHMPRLRRRGSMLTAVGMRPDASGLSGWPIAQVFAWSRPENSRYVLIVALMAVQGGSSAIAGLSVVAMYFVASYLAALLSATLAVAKSAAVWLRATPITLVAFVWSVSGRALVHQLVGSALAVGVMLLLGSPVALVLQIAGLWLGLFVSIAGFALVDGYHGRSPAVKIALSVAAFAVAAAFLQMRGARA